VATPGLLLVQVPPGEELVSVLQYPAHTTRMPEIADGSGLTIMVVVVTQLPGMV
jgi:hypothetical protein